MQSNSRNQGFIWQCTVGRASCTLKWRAWWWPGTQLEKLHSDGGRSSPNKLSLQVATRNTSLSDSNILSPWACSSKNIWLNLANWWLVPHLGQVPLGYETLTQSFANRTLNPPSHRLRPLPRRWDLLMSPAWMVQVWALNPALVEENPVHHLERIDSATPIGLSWFMILIHFLGVVSSTFTTM